jgi:predicted secreted Zn-dependent protease
LVACAHHEVAAAPLAVAPEVVIPGSALEFYDLQGATAVDVVQSMVENAPSDGNLQHAAQTHWEVVWRYPAGPDDAPEACDLDQVDVHLDVLTEFPRWDPPADANPADVAEWYRYTSALAGHETEHVALIGDLAGTIPAVMAASDCAHADAAGQAVLDTIRDANRDLDTHTRDGATEGAALAWLGGRDAAEAFAGGLPYSAALAR